MISEEVLVSQNYNSEVKSNKYVLRCMIITFFVYSAAWLLNVLHIFIVDSKIMNRGMAGVAILMAIILIVTRILGYERPVTKYCIMFLAVCMYSYMVMNLTYHIMIVAVFPLICAVQYSNKAVSVFTYILTIIGITVSVLWGYRYGLCDGNMLLITTVTTAEEIELLNSGDFVINNDIGALLLFFVLPRCMAISAFIPMLNRLRDDIEEKAAHEAAAKRRAEIDDMTGLYNKNKYLAMLDSYYPQLANVGVIFWDVNNLKDVNDAYGHEYGDSLIAVMAESLSRYVNERCRIYRVGGDEFVLIYDNPDAETVEGIADSWKRDIAGKTLDNDIPVTAAYGFATGTGREIENVIKQADEAMYANKKAMKSAKM